MTSSDTVLWDREGAVATITLNRPRARNALTAEMKDALLEALGLAAAEPAVRAVVLTGTGEAFCAGQDLREHADVLASGGEPSGTVRRHYNPIVPTIMTMPKPQLLYSATHGLAESLENEARVQGELGSTADHRAATLAFINRQQPVFQGR